MTEKIINNLGWIAALIAIVFLWLYSAQIVAGQSVSADSVFFEQSQGFQLRFLKSRRSGDYNQFSFILADTTTSAGHRDTVYVYTNRFTSEVLATDHRSKCAAQVGINDWINPCEKPQTPWDVLEKLRAVFQ